MSRESFYTFLLGIVRTWGDLTGGKSWRQQHAFRYLFCKYYRLGYDEVEWLVTDEDGLILRESQSW